VYSASADWLKFGGDYNILGRSMVIHDNTTKRYGCCTIVVTSDSTVSYPAYDASVLKARFTGASFTIFNNSGVANVNVTVTSLANVDNTLDVHRYGPCSAESEQLSTFAFNNSVVTDWKTVFNSTNVGSLAGRKSEAHPLNECTYLIQTAAQTNVNDAYTSGSTASTSSTASTATTSSTTAASASATTATKTGSSSVLLGSLLIVIMVILL